MVKVGMIIRERCFDGVLKEKVERKWRVQKIYPHFVLSANNAGIRTCFSYGDLIVMHIERQPPELEALRIIDGRTEREAHHKNTTRRGQRNVI